MIVLAEDCAGHGTREMRLSLPSRVSTQPFDIEPQRLKKGEPVLEILQIVAVERRDNRAFRPVIETYAAFRFKVARESFPHRGAFDGQRQQRFFSVFDLGARGDHAGRRPGRRPARLVAFQDRNVRPPPGKLPADAETADSAAYDDDHGANPVSVDRTIGIRRPSLLLEAAGSRTENYARPCVTAPYAGINQFRFYGCALSPDADTPGHGASLFLPGPAVKGAFEINGLTPRR